MRRREMAMVDYIKLPTNWREPEPEQEGEEDQELLAPVVDVVYNVYKEKGNAQSIALKISFRFPLKSCQ
jgi:hypothetical protein